MKKSIFIIAVIAVVFSACKNDKKQADTNTMQQKEMQMDSDDGHNHDHSTMSEATLKDNKNSEATTQKNASTTKIIDAYLHIKNALVNDDKNGAAKGGDLLLTAFSNFDMSKLTEPQHTSYMEIYEDAKEQAEHIVKSPIDHQREHFENLSIDVNDLIALLGTNKTLYQSLCPMAAGGKGAIWLSEYQEIKNPFFGSKMLKCGNVQKQIN